MLFEFFLSHVYFINIFYSLYLLIQALPKLCKIIFCNSYINSSLHKLEIDSSHLSIILYSQCVLDLIFYLLMNILSAYYIKKKQLKMRIPYAHYATFLISPIHIAQVTNFIRLVVPIHTPRASLTLLFLSVCVTIPSGLPSVFQDGWSDGCNQGIVLHESQEC